MALEVGSVFAKLGAKLDDDGFNRYERRLEQARREAGRGATTHLKADVDKRGFNEYERASKGTVTASEQASGAARRHGSALGELGKTAAFVAGPAALAGIGLGLKGAFNAYKESERVGRQTNAVLKSTGGAAGLSAKQVNDLANAISNKTGIDDEAIQSGENLLLTFTNVKNEAGKGNDIFNQTTKVMTDMSAALGQDTKSSAIQLGKALNDPVKGVTALQRVGVSFTKSQKDQIKGLVEHGKTLDAQKLILRELNKEFGGSAAATATSSKKLGVTFGNLAESVGRVVSPAFEKVAKGLNSFINGMLNGAGTGGKFLSTMKATFNGVGAVVRGVIGVVNKVLHDNAGTIHSLGVTAGKVFGDVKRLVSSVGAIFRSTFGSGSGTGKDLRGIISVLLSFASTVAKVAESIIKRELPGIITAFRGLATLIKGVIEVIAGILHGDFGKAWDGVKKIFSGALKIVGGILRAGTAPFREIASRAMSALSGAVSHGLDAVVGFFKSLPGRAVAAIKGLGRLVLAELRLELSVVKSVAGWVGHEVSSIGSAIVNGIVGAIKAAPGAVVDAIKSLVPGPLRSVAKHIPGVGKILGGRFGMRAGKGNVGPGAGGPSAFIAGEGGLPEWVISLEGNRGQNVAWAREALEELTGKRVDLHKGGKGKSKKKKAPIKPMLSDATNRGIKRSVARGEAGIKNFERDIQRMETHYSQVDREYGLSEEVILVENDDGSVTVDETALNKRTKELGSLHSLRGDIQAKYGSYGKAVTAASDAYRRGIAKLNAAIKKAKGDARAKERGKYLDERAGYQTRIRELGDVASDLKLDVEDQRIDLEELDGEIAAVKGSKGSAAPAAAPAAEDYLGGDADAIGGAQRELALDTVGMGQEEGDVNADNAKLAGLFGAAVQRAIDAGAPNDVIEALTSTLSGYQSAVAQATADATQSGDETGGGSSGGSSSSTGTDAAPATSAPSPADVAAAAIAQMTSFNAARGELFGNYGSNFMAAGGSGFLGPAALGAGARYFGAGSGPGGKGGAGGTAVTQIISFPTPPADPHGWTAASLHELQAAL